jgi:hypothetical protein
MHKLCPAITLGINRIIVASHSCDVVITKTGKLACTERLPYFLRHTVLRLCRSRGLINSSELFSSRGGEASKPRHQFK